MYMYMRAHVCFVFLLFFAHSLTSPSPPACTHRLARAASLCDNSHKLKLSIILRLWLNYALSDCSRKSFRLRYKARQVSARDRLEVQRLHFSKQTGKAARRVTLEDVKEEMRREAVAITQARRRCVCACVCGCVECMCVCDCLHGFL